MIFRDGGKNIQEFSFHSKSRDINVFIDKKKAFKSRLIYADRL